MSKGGLNMSYVKYKLHNSHDNFYVDNDNTTINKGYFNGKDDDISYSYIEPLVHEFENGSLLIVNVESTQTEFIRPIDGDKGVYECVKILDDFFIDLDKLEIYINEEEWENT